jgi:hypothetical protein
VMSVTIRPSGAVYMRLDTGTDARVAVERAVGLRERLDRLDDKFLEVLTVAACAAGLRNGPSGIKRCFQCPKKLIPSTSLGRAGTSGAAWPDS